MRGLEGRVALVTGAAGGIGREICKRIAEEGVRVVATDLNGEALDQLAEDLSGRTGDIVPMILDITDMAAVEAVVQRVESDHERIDILVNNAGWDVAKPFVETGPELWEQLIRVNLMGPLNLQRAVLPGMIAAGGGKIINMASDAGRVGSSGESVYSACKGGIIAFSKTLAREQASNGILVNAVCPGPTDTPLLRSFVGQGEYGDKIYEGLKRAIPLKRLGQPQDLPGIVAFLASSDADFITGQTISVSGGLTMHGYAEEKLDYQDIICEVRGPAVWISINRPEKYNAFRGQTCEELINALNRAAWDKSVAAIVLTGTGDKAFCTGGRPVRPRRRL